LQLPGCSAPVAISVAPHPTLRPPTPQRSIQLATIPSFRSPVNGGRVQYCASFCQTNVSPAHSPTARRHIRQPCQGPSCVSPKQLVVCAGLNETSSPCHRQQSSLNPSSDAGMVKVENEKAPVMHEKAPVARRAASMETLNPVLEPSEREENKRLQPPMGPIDDSNTTAPPSPTVYYGTPGFTNRDLGCDDVQLRVAGPLAPYKRVSDSSKLSLGSSLSRSDLNAQLPKLSQGSSGCPVLGLRRSKSEGSNKARAGQQPPQVMWKS